MGQVSGVDLSCIGIVFLLLPNIVDGAVAGVGILVDLAVADTLETARAVQSGPEAADPREHIKIADQIIRHLHRFAAQAESRGRCRPRPRPAAARSFLLQRQIPRCAVPPGRPCGCPPADPPADAPCRSSGTQRPSAAQRGWRGGCPTPPAGGGRTG